MLYWFLPYKSLNQPYRYRHIYVYIYISPPSEPPSHLPLPHFTPLDHHRALGRAPCAKYERFASHDPLPPKSWDNWSLYLDNSNWS